MIKSGQPTAALLSSVQLIPELTGVQRLQLGIGLGEPDQVQFVLLALAQPPLGITVCPELALCHILSTGDLHTDPQDNSIHRSGREWLVSFVAQIGISNVKIGFEPVIEIRRLAERRPTLGTGAKEQEFTGALTSRWCCGALPGPSLRLPSRLYFFPTAASLMAFRCGRSRSSSWQAASYIMPFSRLMGNAMVHGRVYTTGSVTVAW
jgi:hypothetical protein